MTIQAAFAEELARLQNCDDRFLALLGQDRELDLAFLNVKNRIRDIALLEHMLIFTEFQYVLSRRPLWREIFWGQTCPCLDSPWEPPLARPISANFSLPNCYSASDIAHDLEHIPDRAIDRRDTKASTEVAGRALALRRAWRKS